MRRGRFYILIGFLVLSASSCAVSRQSAETPFPSLQPVSDLFSHAPSPSPSASPSASPGASSSSRPGGSAKPAAHASSASSGKTHCPSGRVGAEVDDVHVSDSGDAPSRGGDHHWNVSVAGTATNGTSAAVRSVRLNVTVHASNDHAKSVDVTVGQTIGAGGSAPWSTSFQYRSVNKPVSDASVSVMGWSWANSSLAVCPT